MPYLKLLHESSLVQDYCVQLDLRGADISVLRAANNDLVVATFMPLGWFNVRNYGAVGDGLTDDTLAIQATLDAVTANGGGVCYIPKGRYLISNTLLVGSYTHVLGAGRRIAVLVGHAGGYVGKTVNGHGVTATLAMVAVSYSIVEHLTVDHFTNGTIANGITMEPDGVDSSGTPTSHCVIQFCEILGHPVWEYLIWNLRGQFNKILFNDIDGNTMLSGLTEGIECFGSYGCLVLGNTIRRIGGSAILVSCAQFVANASNKRTRVLGNIIEYCDQGIGVATCWDAINGPQDLDQITVAQNTIRGARIRGLVLSSPLPGVTITDVVFDDNRVYDSVVGIYCNNLLADTSHKGIVFRGNTIRSCTDLTGAVQILNTIGVRLDENNVEESSGHAFYLVTSDELVMRGNTVDGAQFNAVIVSLCNDLEIRDGNTFRRFNGDGAFKGIGMSNVNGAIVCHNSFKSTPDLGLIEADATCNEVRIYGNERLAGSSDIIINNFGTNPNFGEFTFVLGAVFTDIVNTLSTDEARFHVEQTAGTIRPFSVIFVAGGFRVTMNAASDGTETFRWEIVQ